MTMRHSTSRNLYRYWNEVRGDRVAPRRLDIEPSRIPDLLPETFILEAVNEAVLRYRLAGTRLTDQFGKELRGDNFLALWHGQDRVTLMKKLATVISSGSPAVIVTEAYSARGGKAVFEFVVLPLIHTQGAIDRLLGAASPANSPSWLGQEPIVRQRLIHVRLITPERANSTHKKTTTGKMPSPGAPALAVVEGCQRLPHLSHVRNARIVRQDRRQFRVYDGGLLTRAPEI